MRQEWVSVSGEGAAGLRLLDGIRLTVGILKAFHYDGMCVFARVCVRVCVRLTGSMSYTREDLTIRGLRVVWLRLRIDV